MPREDTTEMVKGDLGPTSEGNRSVSLRARVSYKTDGGTCHSTRPVVGKTRSARAEGEKVLRRSTEYGRTKYKGAIVADGGGFHLFRIAEPYLHNSVERTSEG